jgi:hypothetical protein
MAIIEQVLYEGKAERSKVLRSVMYMLIPLSIVIIFTAITRSQETLPVWPFLVLPVLLILLLRVLLNFSASTFTISKSIKGELRYEIKKKDQVILYGQPRSVYYWTRVKSTMMGDGNSMATLLELKSRNGDVIGLMSGATNEQFEKTERRTTGFEGKFPVYVVKDVGQIIRVLHQEGIPFSFK